MSAQPQGQAPTGQQQPMQLLKVDDVPKLQSLNEDLKQKYRPIFQQLWNTASTKPAGSPEHTQARTKLQEFSQKLIAQERAFRARAKANAAQQNQASGGEQSQSSAAGQQNPQPKVEQNQSAPTQQPPQNQNAMQQPPNQVQGQGPPQQGDQRPQIEPEIVKHVQNFTYWLPVNGAQPGTPEGEAKIKEMRNSYLMALNKQHKAKGRIAMLDNMVQQRQKSGQEIPPEVANNKAQMQKEYNAAKDFVDTFREKQKQNKMEHDQRRAQQQQQQNQQNQDPPSQPQFAQQQRQNSQPNIKAEPAIKIEGQLPQVPPAQQFGNMQGGPQQPQQQPPPPQQGAPQAPPSMPQQQPMRQPPAPLQQHNQLPNQHPQFAQPGQPQPHQQPPRPQINPHQANGMPHAQTTNSPHPQSATSNAGRPVPLSHQDAVNAAQRSYSDNAGLRTATPLQGQGNFHTPGSREREQMNNPKMPIPRNLNTSQPSPVPMGPARPTISGPTNGAPGPMGQPVITRMPPFQLEGDNDRVLSKRKLDELVRQVTGGSEEALTAEVEEAVLQMADDFVDTVISNACKLAKLRESPQLDIRDLQLVLERNYNIRIPGYASDEVRTVRRLVPAPGWTQKMNAVQAAKVMGGKTDI
ncbi:uncharacterized protein N0V89_011006 [Didymosphaeria variabile]|uniref:Transcription initiation factor TFIID subunit 12 domain-containing protein n=1 Tax=Didymosphaeria variabile TaxID=1932322 RepID=A0A9W8XCD7_9PLEO|nr:uncharacterized protein N0V89_011006 [Didymosphaeria variabile]KAJ4347070.1 hypothetical protein N0V89_011006 [Didymosphaeria variabile]